MGQRCVSNRPLYFHNDEFLQQQISLGCYQCICMFGSCEQPISLSYQGIQIIQEDERLAWIYQLPHERIRPDPPLSPEVSEWLKGKQDRRLKFVQGYKDIVSSLHRLRTCPIHAESRLQTFGSYSSDGVYLAHDGL